MGETLQDTYERLTPAREPFWERARDFASLTVPSLFPELGHNAWTRFDDPFQSVGAGGLASMTSKLLVALFPPGLRFFAIDIDPVVKVQAEQQQKLADLETQRDQREAVIQFAIERAAFRVRASEAIKLLLVSGTAVLQRTARKRWRVWRLPQFVAEVDGEDMLLTLVLCETVRPDALKPEIAALPAIAKKLRQKPDSLELYTGFLWNGTRYDSWQEIEGEALPKTETDYAPDKLPVHLARFEPICGESYGRAMIERVYGDLASLEGLQQSIVELGAEAARMVWGVRPNSVARPHELAGAPNGSYVTMNEGDVFALQAEKLSDLTVVSRIAEGVRADIQQQLGLRMGVQRDSERTTAYEIATMAQELDSTLGGTYSALSEELQLPVLRIIEAELIREGDLNTVQGDPVRTRIIAGLEGLGRQIEFNQTSRFLAAAAGVPPEEAHGYAIDNAKILSRLARATGLDPRDVMRSPEAAAALRKQAAQARQAETLGPEAFRQGGAIVQQALNGSR